MSYDLSQLVRALLLWLAAVAFVLVVLLADTTGAKWAAGLGAWALFVALALDLLDAYRTRRRRRAELRSIHSRSGR